MLNNKKRWSVNFDLHIDLLEKYFSSTNPKDAYRVVGRFFIEKGFEHRLGSGYVSVDLLSKKEITDIIYEMFEKMPWIYNSSRHIDFAEVNDNVFDAKQVYDDKLSNMKIEPKKYVKNHNANKSVNKRPKSR